jgi:hypothetical protein
MKNLPVNPLIAFLIASTLSLGFAPQTAHATSDQATQACLAARANGEPMSEYCAAVLGAAAGTDTYDPVEHMDNPGNP